MNKEVKEKALEIKNWFQTCNPQQTNHRDAIKRAAKMLWHRQTIEEQERGTTLHHNARGYNGYDADFAMRIVNWKGTLPPRMALAARKMLKKYSRQLAEIKLGIK